MRQHLLDLFAFNHTANEKMIEDIKGLDACLSRVRARDQSIHINVSDDHVMAINAQVMDKVFAFDGEIDNNTANAEDILNTFKK